LADRSLAGLFGRLRARDGMARIQMIACCLALAGCGDGQSRLQTRLEARQAAVDPPELWQVEQLGPGDVASAAVRICVDTRLREGFSRARVEADGEVCVPSSDFVDAVDAPLTCFLRGSRFLVRTYRTGDPARDFTVLIVVRQMDGARTRTEKRMRYRKLGACPANWAIGQQAKLRPPAFAAP
jgi:hypothetical protein